MILTRILHDSCKNHARYVQKSGKFMQESCKKSCMILARYVSQVTTKDEVMVK